MGILIKIAFLPVIGYIWYLGGQGNRRLRLILVPIFIGLGAGLIIKDNILARVVYGLLVCGSFQAIRIGYGNYSPEDDPKPSFLASWTHDRNGWWIRAIWGLIVATSGTLALVAGHYIGYGLALMYILGYSALNFCVSRFRLPVLPCDLLVGAGLPAILLLIK